MGKQFQHFVVEDFLHMQKDRQDKGRKTVLRAGDPRHKLPPYSDTPSPVRRPPTPVFLTDGMPPTEGDIRGSRSGMERSLQ